MVLWKVRKRYFLSYKTIVIKKTTGLRLSTWCETIGVTIKWPSPQMLLNIEVVSLGNLGGTNITSIMSPFFNYSFISSIKPSNSYQYKPSIILSFTKPKKKKNSIILLFPVQSNLDRNGDSQYVSEIQCRWCTKQWFFFFFN